MRPVSKLRLGAVVLVASCIAVVSASAGSASPADTARAQALVRSDVGSNPAGPAGQTHLTQTPTLVWSDEFNGPAGSQPSAADWGNEIGRIRNHEAQYYTNRPQNEREDGNGHLIIEARRENYQGAGYTSASLTTAGKHEFKYGRFEMKAKIPTASGDWPAFWALGTNVKTTGWPHSGEIDMMEYYRNTLLYNVMDSSGHWSSTKEPLPAGFSDSYHIWDMDWTPDQIILSRDGDIKRTYNVNDATVNGYNPFRQPWFLILNLAIGGTNGGDPSKTVFPQDYSIDYVRVYDTSGSGGGHVGPITSGLTGKCADDYHNSSTNGTIVDLYNCNGSAAQQWTVASGGTLQINGKCMDVTNSGTANGTRVQLYDCNGTGAQKWTQQADGSLLNPNSGKCLDDPSSSTTNGTQLQIYTCNGTNAQKWKLP